MRQLNISKQPIDPTWETDRANALPLLQKLAAARPLGETADREEQLLRFIASVAMQYWGRGAAWESLLTVGWEGAVGCYDRYAERLGDFCGYDGGVRALVSVFARPLGVVVGAAAYCRCGKGV
ncbi:MAG: hypothetical protein ACRYFX_07625 [Janthinobacterium lividum]